MLLVSFFLFINTLFVSSTLIPTGRMSVSYEAPAKEIQITSSSDKLAHYHSGNTKGEYLSISIPENVSFRKVLNVTLTVMSHDQGWYTHDGSSTADVRIVHNGDEKKKFEGVYSNTKSTDENLRGVPQKYTWTMPDADLPTVQPGMKITFEPRVQYEGWANYVHSASFSLWYKRA
ncbi:hypothetical protein ROZALSC1DRAFT_29664 [Rozella allomycis CSF55]|uniref:Arrestin-like N-terminal domain-containing protein n=1 Tax=Rozella allomycis (strain CSF55) TaxID=988480 RepID=A0A075AVE6_ROZAC|nr:hypothetical protein O9G_001846 [Rozella allomycis CSF55]RKP18670.1 hypothetical protein ROZALSC1DRAFT_29664 [Rozella allomycis CSF55]|eukprot:EPZ34233.1 hypothetical protein O9G_001846 [Rozella allomycis CSF55]